MCSIIPPIKMDIPVEMRQDLATQSKKQDESYISLAEIARPHSEDTPGYIIQNWLRNGNTLAFLDLWEHKNNPDYRETGYVELLTRKESHFIYINTKTVDRSHEGNRHGF